MSSVYRDHILRHLFQTIFDIFMKQYSILSEKRYQYVLTLIFSSTTKMQIFHLGNQSLLSKLNAIL